MPKVSIIVPVYNVEQYLKECMDTIIHQTLQDIEIICINDGSTDNSGRILDKYASVDHRIKVIHKENGGYGIAMNLGLDNATGEYIGIVEPDDYIDLNMYECLYKKAKETSVDIVKADYCRFIGDINNREIVFYENNNNPNYYNKIINLKEDILPFSFPMNTWSGIYKRDFIEKYKIRHNETPGASFQDNGFWFQTFALAQNIYYIDKTFYYNRRDNINSSVKNPNKVYCIVEEYAFIRNFIDKYHLYDKLIHFYTYKKFANYLWNYNRIDVKFKKQFLDLFAKELKIAKDKDELIFDWCNKKEARAFNLILKNSRKFYYKSLNKLTLAQKIFSITNNRGSGGKYYKVLRFFGVKISVRNKKKELELAQKAFYKQVEQQQNLIIKKLAVFENFSILEKISKLDSELKTHKTLLENLLNEEYKLQNGNKRILAIENENLYAHIFNNLIYNTEWLVKKNFIPTGGAANYSLLFGILVTLNYVKPKNILEFGMGQSSKLTCAYAKFNHEYSNLQIIEHDKNWIDVMSNELKPSVNVKLFQKKMIKTCYNNTQNDIYEDLSDIVKDTKYDFILIDGPYGYNSTYPRMNVLNLIPSNLAKDFVIIMDDAERAGEKNTAQLIFKALENAGIQYSFRHRGALKTQLIITSKSLEFINLY